MSKVSIIMPVYNAERFLRSTLESLLTQSFHDWECLCVNDGSSDHSGKILDEYADREVRFKVFHCENQGPAKARNFAMERATGDYVMFSDADDRLHPQAIEKLLQISEETGAELIRYGHRQVLEHSYETRELPQNYTIEVVDFVSSHRAPTYYAYCGVFSFLTRGLAEKVRWPLIRNGEDGLFAVRCLKESKKSIVTNLPLVDYLQHEGSGTKNRSLTMYRDILRYFQEVTTVCESFREFRFFKGDLRHYVRGGILLVPGGWGCDKENEQAWIFYRDLLRFMTEQKKLFRWWERALFDFCQRMRNVALLKIIELWPRAFSRSCASALRFIFGGKVLERVRKWVRR